MSILYLEHLKSLKTLRFTVECVEKKDPAIFTTSQGEKNLLLLEVSEYQRALSKKSNAFNRIFAFWPKITRSKS